MQTRSKQWEKGTTSTLNPKPQTPSKPKARYLDVCTFACQDTGDLAEEEKGDLVDEEAEACQGVQVAILYPEP